MILFSELYKSAVAKKAVMAITGTVLFGFVLGHMAGNLKIFQGTESFNAYSKWLREVGYPLLPHGGALWLVRVVLLVAVVLHIWSAVELTRMSRRARPDDYVRRRGLQLDYAARTMRWSGVLVGSYVVYHLMHLTFGTVHHDFVAGNPYHNLISGFQLWPVSAVYLAANVLLGFHLYHGLWSIFQSLGWNDGGYGGWRRGFAITFSVLTTLGFISVPLAVMTRVVS
ncbi:MAG: succinate dehydrogenase cytochrome b subunit [Vicinamibacteria bacterium]